MDNRKLKIFFDGEIFEAAVSKSANRSGIFFTAYNVFKQFTLRDDIELTVSIPVGYAKRIKEFFYKEFPHAKLNYYIIGNENIFVLYGCLREKRIECKKNNMPFHRTVYGIFAGLLKTLIVLGKFFSKLKTRKTIADCDVIFSPIYHCENVGVKTPKYTIVYDTIPLIFPEYYFPNNWFVKFIRHLNHDDFYFADSNSARNDFLKYCPQIDPEKITVTPLACNERFVPADENAIAQARKKYNIPEGKKYVFSLCTLEPRKNLIRAVKTFVQFIKKNNIDDLVFVLGGGHWEHFIGKLKNEIADLGEYQNKIIRAGYIDDEDVPRLYSGAEWFVFTSQYEGFGLPPLEAMSCGCPVITSNNSSLPEVVGDAGIMIDFDSDEQHIKAYEDFYYNSLLRDEYSARGLARAKCFSWEKCADQMINEMKRNLNK